MTKELLRVSSACLTVLASAAAEARVKPRPFSVGAGEGGGAGDGGVTGWLIAEQSRLTHLMSAKVHALHGSPSAVWGLVGLGLAYGVFHAAGPGHGKALIASYMLANDRSLRRGAVMALLAALLQALIAVALVGAAGFVFHATASEMNRAAGSLELMSYAGIVVIGMWLVGLKGLALTAALRARLERSRALFTAPAYRGLAWTRPARTLSAAAYRVASPDETGLFAADCGHAHAPDPVALDGPFSWRDAAGTVIAAGARPCAGAILILVFALSQGLFAAGVAATFAMALGVAVTTGALASLAVFAKRIAMRFAAGEDSRAVLVARGFEFAAALGVLAFGLALMFGARGAG